VPGATLRVSQTLPPMVLPAPITVSPPRMVALAFFLVVNVAKLPTFVAMGWIDASTLRDAIWTIPLLPLGTLGGVWLNRRVPEKPFIVVMYAATTLTAAHMIYRAM